MHISITSFFILAGFFLGLEPNTSGLPKTLFLYIGLLSFFSGVCMLHFLKHRALSGAVIDAVHARLIANLAVVIIAFVLLSFVDGANFSWRRSGAAELLYLFLFPLQVSCVIYLLDLTLKILDTEMLIKRFDISNPNGNPTENGPHPIKGEPVNATSLAAQNDSLNH